MKYFIKIKYVSFLILLFFLFGFLYYPNQFNITDIAVTKNKLHTIADAILKNTTFYFVDVKNGLKYDSAEIAPADARLKIESPYNDWHYWNGLLNIAMIKLGRELNDSSYIKFAVKNIAFNFNNYKYFQNKYKGEDKWGYPFAQRFIMEDLDDYGAMGASLIEVYRLDKKANYKKYIDKAANFIETKQYRYNDGSFIRSSPHKWTLWADDLYMSISFLSRMGKLSGNSKYFNDAAKQVINYNKHLFNAEKGLMYHNWYSDTGKNGAAFWGRANGWALLAQMDLLDRLPPNNPYRDTLISLLKRQINGIKKYQSSNGLWHQLLDKDDSYLETSCSAMFTYVIARAINQGILSRIYSPIAKLGWQGLETKILPNGEIEGVCTGTVVSDNLAYYYNRPAPLNDLHGLGTVLLAGAEVLRLDKGK